MSKLDLFDNPYEYLIQENPYNRLNAENKKRYNNQVNSNDLMLFLIGMFEYEKSEIYKDIDDSTIEKILILNGTNAFWKNNNEKVVCGVSSVGGTLDTNGVGTLVNGTLLNGKAFTGTNGISAVVGWNNSNRLPDLNIIKFASLFSETDISEECVLRYTRNTPIYSVKNNKIKTAIENGLKRIFKGEPITIVDDSVSLTDKKSVECLNLTDSSSIDKMQYLCTYRNDLLRRFYTMYGQALGEGVKLAQQSVAEISSNISSSFVIPLDRLKQRTKMCEELEKVFGGHISVRFTEPWRIEFEKWSNIANGVIDGNFKNDRGVDEIDENFKSNRGVDNEID